LNFFNGENEKSIEFSDQLPEFKVSMAKLQGHLLKYKSDVDACVRNAKEIIKDSNEG
jgi:hypothetical protein